MYILCKCDAIELYNKINNYRTESVDFTRISYYNTRVVMDVRDWQSDGNFCMHERELCRFVLGGLVHETIGLDASTIIATHRIFKSVIVSVYGAKAESPLGSTEIQYGVKPPVV
jgi:hypothetical protein